MVIKFKSAHKSLVLPKAAEVKPKASAWMVEVAARDGNAALLAVQPPQGEMFYTLSTVDEAGKPRYCGKTGVRLTAELAQAFARLLASIQ
jgi:hypothetical protein